MFDRPPAQELLDERQRRRQAWLTEGQNQEVGLVGGGLDALTAGCFLERNDRSTLLLEESEYLGGRLSWSIGPVPIFSPAVKLLEELNFTVEESSPVWLDRNGLLSFLVGAYLDEGGIIQRGIHLKGRPVQEAKTMKLPVARNGLNENLDFRDLIMTLPEYGSDTISAETDDPLEYEVKATRRSSNGWIEAGLAVLPENKRRTASPLESAHLISGRKAAEIVLNNVAK